MHYEGLNFLLYLSFLPELSVIFIFCGFLFFLLLYTESSQICYLGPHFVFPNIFCIRKLWTTGLSEWRDVILQLRIEPPA